MCRSALGWPGLARRLGSSMLLALMITAVAMPACGRRSRRAASAEVGGKRRAASADVGGKERSYELYEPTHSSDEPLPLMIVLHGGLGNAESIRKTTRMDAVADRGPFFVVYPNGIGGRGRMKNRRTWNAGRCCGKGPRAEVDHVAFIERMIIDLAQSHRIDESRVYVAGFSNGAMMAYRLACELPARIAAIIPVSGTLSVDSCDRGKDVAVFHIHGMADSNVPYRGGKGTRGVSGVAHRSVSETMAIITRPRDCGRPEEDSLGSGDRESIYACARGAPVKLRLIAGGQHRWPDGSDAYRKFSASVAAWEFAQPFGQRSKRSSPADAGVSSTAALRDGR